MEKMNSKLRIFLILFAALAMAFCFSASPVSAAAKTKVNLIKHSNIAYNAKGLIKSLVVDDDKAFYTYNSAGQLTSVKLYDFEGRVLGECEGEYVFLYDGGKLEAIHMIRGETEYDMKAKIGKNNRILQVMMQDGEYSMVVSWKYNAKDLVKESSEELFENGYSQDMDVRKYTRNKNGYITKIAVDGFEDEQYTCPFTNKITSGKVTKITVKTGEGHKYSKSFKYTSKKIAKKYVKAVKMQQLYLLYRDIPEAYDSIFLFV